jgi:hypothetical protein
MRLPPTVNRSFDRVKRSSRPLRRNDGYRARLAKKFSKARPSWMIAICGAFFVTSSIQGNCSRLMALSWRRSDSCDGAGSAGSALCAAYWRCHSASAQL